MAGRSNLEVVVRFRPASSFEEAAPPGSIEIDAEGRAVAVSMEASDTRQGLRGHFSFAKILDQYSTQFATYEAVAKPIVEAVKQGCNGAILAYGQTGSGKTWSMMGPDLRNISDGVARPSTATASAATLYGDETHGVLPLAMMELCNWQQRRKESCSISCSLIEIYQEKIYDLLGQQTALTLANAGSVDKRGLKPIKVRERPDGSLWMSEVEAFDLEYPEQVHQWLELGARRRHQARTRMNAASSRSHAVFVITVDQWGEGNRKRSQLLFVDLAGSERVSKTGASGQQLGEAACINASLHTLGRCVSAIVDRKQHVPFRDSVLTRLISQSFGGNSRTSMLLCCSSDDWNLPETVSTLRFGDMAAKVENTVVVNVTADPVVLRAMLDAERRALAMAHADMAALRAEAERLRRENRALRMRCGVTGSDAVWDRAAAPSPAAASTVVPSDGDSVHRSASTGSVSSAATRPKPAEEAAVSERAQPLAATEPGGETAPGAAPTVRPPMALRSALGGRKYLPDPDNKLPLLTASGYAQAQAVSISMVDLLPSLMCPLSRTVLRCPVVAADGRTYDAAAWKAHIQNSSRSPCTGEVLTTKLAIGNKAIERLLQVVRGALPSEFTEVAFEDKTSLDQIGTTPFYHLLQAGGPRLGAILCRTNRAISAAVQAAAPVWKHWAEKAGAPAPEEGHTEYQRFCRFAKQNAVSAGVAQRPARGTGLVLQRRH